MKNIRNELEEFLEEILWRLMVVCVIGLIVLWVIYKVLLHFGFL